VIADRGPRLLVADDDDAVREVLVLLLEMQGFEVHAVTNGHEACVAARERRPDLLLLDVMMPVLDGWSALRELKADPATSTIPVLLVSALGARADERSAAEFGAAGYVTKPFRSHELLARVDALLVHATGSIDGHDRPDGA
jgi:DNA-binding response OmpR family regulator